MLMSLQALRALAAWVVVFHHFMQIFFNFHAEGPVGELFATRGAVGVDIFFVVSGVVIFLTTDGREMPWRRFLALRVVRIVPAYWLCSAAAAALMVFAAPVMPTQRFELEHFLLSLFFIPAQNPAGYGPYPTLYVGWTLNFEMLFYLIFALVLIGPQRYRPLLLGAALFVVSAGLSRLPWVSDFYRNTIVYEFLFGVGIGWAYRRGWLREGFWVPLAMVLGSLLVIARFDDSQRLLHWGVPSAVLVAACLCLESRFAGVGGLARLGDCSYSVYLLHILVLSLGWYGSQRWGLSPYLMLAFCVPLIGALAWASYELIERRLTRLLRGRLVAQPAALQG